MRTRARPDVTSRLLPGAACALVVTLGPWIASEAASGSLPKSLAALAFAAALPAAIARPDVFVNAGLLLVASDKFMARDIGALTLKPGYVAFGYAFLGAFVSWIRRPSRDPLRDVPRVLLASVGSLLVLYLIATAFAVRPSTAARYLLVIAGGALVPIAAVLAVTRTPDRIARALQFFVLGQLLVACYGLYQFVAAYLSLPAPVPSTSTLPDSTGGVMRVSGISQEAAYHAAYVILGLPLILSDVLRGVRRISSRLPPSVIAAMVILSFLLTVSRAGYLGVPLVFVGIWVIHRRRRHETSRQGLTVVVTALVALGLVVVVGAATGFRIFGPLRSHLANFWNPHEVTSNAIRVQLYDTVSHVVSDHPVLGVGPDNLGYVVPSYGMAIPPGTEHAVTANNIWLQGAADAGLLTVPFIAGLIWAAISLVRKRPAVEAATLALGTAVFLLVSGAFVSFLWDMKVWAVLGLAIVAQWAPPAEETPPLIG